MLDKYNNEAADRSFILRSSEKYDNLRCREISQSDNSNDKSKSYDDLIFKILTDCVNQQEETELSDHINELTSQDILHDYFKMLAITDTTTMQPDIFTENSILGKDGRISLAYENLKHIPQKIAENFSKDIKFLDLSFNNFKDLSFLSIFKGLHTLILDKNSEPDETTLPYLPNLHILWLNNCNITNIPKWIYRIQLQCPKLKQLSLIGNPGARTQLTGASNTEENDFRLFISESLKSLTHLDGIQIQRSSFLSTPNLNFHTSLKSPLIIRNTFGSGNLNHPATEISLPSLLQQHHSTIKKAKSSNFIGNNNNSSLFSKNSSINSQLSTALISHASKISSSPSVKSYYYHNSQQHYHEYYSKPFSSMSSKKDINNKKKQKSAHHNKNINSSAPVTTTTTTTATKTKTKKKRVPGNSFKNLFGLKFDGRKTSQSSTTS